MLLVGYLTLARRLQKPDPEGPRYPKVRRVGRFAGYAKRRQASFRQPGSMTLHRGEVEHAPLPASEPELPPQPQQPEAAPEGSAPAKPRPKRRYQPRPWPQKAPGLEGATPNGPELEEAHKLEESHELEESRELEETHKPAALPVEPPAAPVEEPKTEPTAKEDKPEEP